MVIFDDIFKSLPCFQCSWNLQGIFIDDWSGDLQDIVYKKNLSSGFLNSEKFVGMDQITCKNCKSSWVQVNQLRTSHRPEQFPSFSVRSFQWNQTTMRYSRVSKAHRFLKILANCVDSMLFHSVFLWFIKILKLSKMLS